MTPLLKLIRKMGTDVGYTFAIGRFIKVTKREKTNQIHPPDEKRK